MDSEQINKIVSWILSHLDHVYECDDETFEDDSPAEAWARFCRDPTLVNEYEDCDNHRMLGPQVSQGCTHIFSKGSCKGGRCNVSPVPGNDRCSFHDHPVFSPEVRRLLHKNHSDINQSFVSRV